ncbi:MAG: chromate transporter [Spirochaetaceae bacterium]|nr:chromate transporter [Spirochaetaceae bacterium]
MLETLSSLISSHSALGVVALFALFFYIGLFTLGGGLVGITLMQQVLVKNLHLIDEGMFYNMVAISESTPGPIGVNMATYLGTELYGVAGGVITTLGQVSPSIITIIIVARFFAKVQDKPLVKAAFSALRPATSGIVAVAAANVFVLSLLQIPQFKETGNIADIFNFQAIFFYIIGLVFLFKAKIHPIFMVILGGFFGVLFL